MSKNKSDPDKGLAPGQFPKLNKIFYDNYIEDYFLIKLDSLLNIIARTSEYQKSINDVEIELGKFKRNLDGIDDEELKKYGKLELATTYFHCLETFIRLFIAHAKLKPCPWLELSKLTIEKYRHILNNLSKGIFNLNNELNDENTVLYVLTGYKKLPEEINQIDLDGLKEWIIWAANELINNYEYNTFKHGLVLYTNNNGFTYSDKDKVLLQKHGECLEFISKTERENRCKWVRETVFIKYDSRAAIIFIFGNMIKSIISVGKCMYTNGEYKSEWLPTHEFNPDFIFKSDEQAIPGIPITIKSMKMELLYFKDIDKELDKFQVIITS